MEKDKRGAAEAFWEKYDIPHDVDVALKLRENSDVRTGGLRIRGDSKIHLYIHEEIDEGSFTRSAERCLCREAERPHPGVRFETRDGEEYRPKVTCGYCLQLMQHWRCEV